MASWSRHPVGGSAPYEQLVVDRGLTERSVNRTQVASSGATRSDAGSDVEIVTHEAASASSVTARFPPD